MGQSKSYVKLLTSSIHPNNNKKKLNENDVTDNNSNSRCVTTSVKTNKWEKEFLITFGYTKSDGEIHQQNLVRDLHNLKKIYYLIL